MSQQDVEIVRRSFDAWNEGDVEAIRGMYTEDAVFESGSSSSAGAWMATIQSELGCGDA
jgi:ketosteroid isomerase-like protein